MLLDGDQIRRGIVRALEPLADPDAAREVNIDGLRRFLSCGLNVRLLFFASTDCVYGENDERHPRFAEDDPLLPVNEYGKQKAEAEAIVRASGFTVLRFPFLVGPSLCEKPNFYDSSVKRLQNGESIEMIDGMVRSALSYQTTAGLLVRLSEAELPAAAEPERSHFLIPNSSEALTSCLKFPILTIL